MLKLFVVTVVSLILVGVLSVLNGPDPSFLMISLPLVYMAGSLILFPRRMGSTLFAGILLSVSLSAWWWFSGDLRLYWVVAGADVLTIFIVTFFWEPRPRRYRIPLTPERRAEVERFMAEQDARSQAEIAEFVRVHKRMPNEHDYDMAYLNYCQNEEKKRRK